MGSKTAPRIFIFSIVLGAEYSSYMKSIAIYALTFFGYIISVLASVNNQATSIALSQKHKYKSCKNQLLKHVWSIINSCHFKRRVPIEKTNKMDQRGMIVLAGNSHPELASAITK